MTTKEFVERSRAVHGDEFDYSSTECTGAAQKVTIVCKKHGPFTQIAMGHMSGNRCNRCSRSVSKVETAWLDSLGISQRQKRLTRPTRRITVDGYDEISESCYEFLGDYWHGNPQVYRAEDMHLVAKVTFGVLYTRTMRRLHEIAACGYRVIYIWERDWKAGLPAQVLEPGGQPHLPQGSRSPQTSLFG